MDLTQALICQRWEMPLAPDSAGGRWFLDWVRREPRQASAHVTAGFCAYRSLSLVLKPGDIATAAECFGGLGAQSLIIRGLFAPVRHTVTELHPEAVAHLHGALPGADVHQGDAYAAPAPGADLVGLDFGDLTAYRLRPGEQHRALLDDVMAHAPKAVVLTDIAGPRLHLHRERYAEVLHGPVTDYPAYLASLVHWLEQTYGYALVRGYFQRWSAVLALVPRECTDQPGVLRPVPDEPKGIEFS